jgi:hypothetical protein
MSIDARVKTVVFYGGVGGEIQLVDRPARPGGVPGIAGQSVLKYTAAPPNVGDLAGLDVWGGSNEIMLGDMLIARRKGYTQIVFVSDAAFTLAVAEYHKRAAK